MFNYKSNFILISILFLFVSILSGCATTGPQYSSIKPSIPVIEYEKGRIFFYRPSSLGAAIIPNVLLNNEKVGEAKSWGFFYVDRSPGNFEVLLSTEVDKRLTFTLEQGQTRYVRMAVVLGVLVWRVYPELVDKDVAESEMEELRYTGTKVVNSKLPK